MCGIYYWYSTCSFSVKFQVQFYALYQLFFFFLHSESSDEEKEEDAPLAELQEKLTELATTQNIIQQKHHDLVRAFSEFEAGKDKNGAKLKEKAAMFKITADALTKVSWDSTIEASVPLFLLSFFLTDGYRVSFFS